MRANTICAMSWVHTALSIEKILNLLTGVAYQMSMMPKLSANGCREFVLLERNFGKFLAIDDRQRLCLSIRVRELFPHLYFFVITVGWLLFALARLDTMPT